MASLDDNLNIGWYGKCDECTDFDFYDSNADLHSAVANIISVIQIKAGGYVYVSWSHERDQAQRVAWNNLPTNLKSSVEKIDFIKDGQGITELKCGNPYLIKLTEGTSTEIPHLHLSDLGQPDMGRVIECLECPDHPNCICTE